MNENYSKVFVMVTSPVLSSSSPADSFQNNDYKNSNHEKSYLFKTYLKGNFVKIQAVNGVVTLTGIATL